MFYRKLRRTSGSLVTRRLRSSSGKVCVYSNDDVRMYNVVHVANTCWFVLKQSSSCIGIAWNSMKAEEARQPAAG